jgi:hypothetical protein
MKTVPEMLRDCAQTYEERNAIYGNNYKLFGHIMQSLFPYSVVLKTPEDHNRFGIFVQIVAKITRYAAQFHNGGHDDSLLDTSVYAQMLREIDAEIKAFRDHGGEDPR